MVKLFIPMKITKPTLLVNEEISRRNIAKMTQKAAASDVIFAPHFKTHQSQAIGQWFKDEGVKAITVSSIDMAMYFAKAGWHDITIAFPINLLEINLLRELAAKVNLSVLVTDPSTVGLLDAEVDVRTEIMIEIDCGYKRSGVWHEDHHVIQSIIDRFEHSHHAFRGFYCHSGHTYHERGKEAVQEIYHDAIHKLHDLQLRFADVKPKISVGDTPSCSLIEKFDGVYSIHPGNFVFYDLTQVQVGSCEERDIAVVLAVPIVSKNERRLQLVVHGGGVHLSKDMLETDEGRIYGRVVLFTANNCWGESLADCAVISISQEHGIVQVSKAVYDSLSIGDVIGILPVHSCMTADVMGEMYTTTGKSLDHLKKSL